jgi:protein ImuB
LFLLKRLLHPIVDRLASREEGVGELSIGLQLEDGDFIEDRIRPSEPTRQIHVLLDLTRLRLESRGLSADVESLSVDVKPVGIHPGQQPLFGRRSQRDIQRDLGAGSRALARVRAELGDDSVCRARLRRAHLPDAQFVWEPMTGLASPGSKKAGSAPSPEPPPPEPPPPESRSPNQTGRALIRRFCSKPVPLTRRHRKFSSELAEAEEKARGEPMGDLEEIRLPEELGGGAPSGCAGPYLVSGGWWIEPVFREYCFLQSRRGDLLWVYYDRRRRRWYMCGKVE